MSEFGHNHLIGALKAGKESYGICIDGWGAGPFVIMHDGKLWRFEDSDRFGPALVKRNGDPLAKPWPGERSVFWRLHHIWRKQGRRFADDGTTCVLEYTEPRPSKYVRRGRNKIIVEHGDHDGCYDGGFIEVSHDRA